MARRGRVRTIVAVVVTPCVEQRRIRDLLATLANHAGFAYGDETALARELSGKTLVACTDARLLADLEPSRVVIIHGPPEGAPAATAAQYGLSPADGLTHAAHCLAQATLLARRAGALMVSTAALARDPAATVTAMADALGFSIARGRLDHMARAYGPAMKELTAPPPSESPLGFYAGGLPALGHSAWWSRDILWSDDTPDRACPEVLDVTGRGRVLAFGPFLSLPPGHWRASFSFSLDGPAAKRPYLLDFGAGDDRVARDEAYLPEAGRYELSVENRWSEVINAQVRLWVMAAAFDGELRVTGARIDYLGEA